MNIKYNTFGKTEKSNVYLCKPGGEKICSLNGINTNTFKYRQNLKDFDSIEFTVDKYININDDTIKSNGYDALNYLMEISVDNIGNFVITAPPSVSNDGIKEQKQIEAKSLEWNFLSKDLTSFKINTGENTSLERLIENNIDALGRTIHYITVYNSDNPKLSLINILLEYMQGWSVGIIDPVIASKTPYFNVDSTPLYSFMMQDMSRYLQCIFQFDTIHKTINIYGEDSIGKDTSVFISFNNLADSINIQPSTEDIYTRYTVRGNNDLDIIQVNFGEEQIEDISHFLTSDYLSPEIIEKYNAYNSYKESKRPDYLNLLKSYGNTLEARDSLINKVPIDALNIDWNTFPLDDLEKELDYYNGLISCIEADYTSNGILDENALKASIYWWDYHSYKTWIIPNIRTAITNYSKTDEEKDDYDNSWETEWDLYGTNELKSKMNLYTEQMESAKNYSKAWSELTPEEKSQYSNETTYTTLHNKYITAQTNYTNASKKYTSLMSKVNSCNEILENTKSNIDALTASVHITDDFFGFTSDELNIIHDLYIDTDYTNNNFSIAAYMTAEEKIDEELKLLNYAKEDLAKQSRPQYSFTTALNNLLALEEFKIWHDDISVGNFIHLGISDTHSEKLRIVSLEFNPMIITDNNLELTFSNMLTWNGQRNDFTDLFDNSISSSKNSIQRDSSSSSGKTELSNELIQYILNSRQMSDTIDTLKLQNLISNEAQFNTALMNYAKIDTLHSSVLTAINATVDTEFVKNLLVGYITAQELFASNTNTDFMTIGTDKNGNKIQINANTLQFVDSNNNVYLQMGIDAHGNKTFLLTDEKGSILIDSDGLHADAVPDGLIVSDMLQNKSSVYNGIDADKLNIDSVVNGINNGNMTINSTKVYFDDEDKSLNTIMQEMSTDITHVSGKLLYDVVITSSNGTQISDTTVLTANVYDYGTTSPAGGSFSYSWYKNGILISDAVNQTYTVNAADIENGAKFTCKVSYS